MPIDQRQQLIDELKTERLDHQRGSIRKKLIKTINYLESLPPTDLFDQATYEAVSTASTQLRSVVTFVDALQAPALHARLTSLTEDDE